MSRLEEARRLRTNQAGRRRYNGVVGAFRRRTRQVREEEEQAMLAPAATLSSATRGRERPEEPDAYRTAFERDRDRILHSKAFRRLKHKTQVFINPEGDHFVTRLTHTLQVTQIGRGLASALSLNETLTEAICLGHDVGHAPFGHTGETALTPYVEGEWLHSEQGIRVLQSLEPLNLSWEVLDGIRSHTWKIVPPPATPEGMVCRFADRIAYLVHDMRDAIAAGVISERDLPPRVVSVFGRTGREWISVMIRAVIEESLRNGVVSMDPEILEPMQTFRNFMFERVYQRPEALERSRRAIAILRALVDHHLEHPEAVPSNFGETGSSTRLRVLDYVSGMTDRFALRLHDDLFGTSHLERSHSAGFSSENASF